MKGSDIEPIDQFIGRLVLAGYGSKREIEEDFYLEECIKYHQQLDAKAEGERITYQMNRPTTR